MKKISIIIFAVFLSIPLMSIHNNNSICSLEVKQRLSFTKEDVRKVVNYVHDTYQNDYTSLPSKETLDWQKACVSMMFVHAYEVLGDAKYLEWAKEAAYVEFNISDDQCWGALAILELNRHGIKPDSRPYTDNKGNVYNEEYFYQNIFHRTLTTTSGKAPAPYTGFLDTSTSQIGGLFWNKEFATYNSCTMGPAIIFGYLIPDKNIEGKTPVDYASTWLNIQKKYIMDVDKGKVYDYYRLSSKSKDPADYSYNYGTVLASLGIAWNKDKERQSDVPNIADAMVNYITTTMTDNNGALYSPNAQKFDRNACAFNGIFMHFIQYYLFSDIPSANKTKLKEYIVSNANIVWKQIHNNLIISKNNFGVSFSWGTMYDSSTTNCMTTVSGVECLLASIQIKENKKPIVN